MASTLEPPRTARVEPVSDESSAPPIRAAFAGWSAVTTLYVLGACALFLYHDYLPLFHSDLWGHVAYGDWMLRHDRLPMEDPFAELAAGVPLYATAWLTQVIYAWVGGGADPEGLAHLFAVLGLATYLGLWLTLRRATASWDAGAWGALTAFLIGWSRHAVQRPENFGLLCLVGLLGLLMLREHRPSRRRDAWHWPLLTGALFALWANLHGSFIVGWVLLGCHVSGRAIDVGLLAGTWNAVWRDGETLRRLTLLEAAVLGSCLNPYGVDLPLQTLLFPAHPNLDSVLEWTPLQLKSLEGIPMAATWIVTALIWRVSPRRLSASEVLAVVVFSLLVGLRVRMITWYGPIWVVAVWPHLTAWLRTMTASSTKSRWFRRPSIRWVAVTVLGVWMTVICAPVSRVVLGGPPRRDEQRFSHETPLGVTAYLREHPPEGLCFVPQWWGDWLVWRGPGGLRVMATTNAIHLLPATVWRDYLAIAEGTPGWEERLERYGIDTVVASVALQPELCRGLARSGGWRIVFEDEVGLIAGRIMRETVQPGEALP